MGLVKRIAAHGKALRSVIALLLISLTAASCCRPDSGPLLPNNDTFMLSYIDRQGRIRVRWSQDGWRRVGVRRAVPIGLP